MTSRKTALKLVALPATLAVAATIAFAAPAYAASGYRSCTAPKLVTLWSDQVGAGSHYYQSSGQFFYTTQPAGQRGRFQTYGTTTATNWSIQAPAFYSYGATCF